MCLTRMLGCWFSNLQHFLKIFHNLFFNEGGYIHLVLCSQAAFSAFLVFFQLLLRKMGNVATDTGLVYTNWLPIYYSLLLTIAITSWYYVYLYLENGMEKHRWERRELKLLKVMMMMELARERGRRAKGRERKSNKHKNYKIPS